MNRETTNDPLAIALCGEKTILARWFEKRGVPITRNILRYAVQPSRHIGLSRHEFFEWIFKGLSGTGKTAKADYLINSFAVLTETEKRKMFGGKWIEDLWRIVGEITALYTAGRFGSEFELKRAEIRALMAAELI